MTEKLWFPDPLSLPLGDQAVPGLIAVGGDLSVDRLLLAYRSGIFPWSDHPITWWSPDPRGILDLAEFHMPRSLRRLIRQQPFRVTRNTAFAEVIAACARPNPRRQDTWISARFIEAYTRLYHEGWAHSFECWVNDQLVGGLYGVAIGGLFAGESMFHLQTGASKIAVVHAVEHLRQQNFTLFDLQMVTPVTSLLGAQAIPRRVYLERLRTALSTSATFQ